MEINNKSHLKQIKIKFGVFFFVIIVIIIAFIIIMSVQQINNITSTMVSIAGMPLLEQVSGIIDGNEFERLSKELDPTDPVFVRTQQQFREIKEGSQSLFLYAMAPYDGDVHVFIFDAEEPGSELYSPLGYKEDTSDYDPAYLRTLLTGEPNFSPLVHNSSWGRLISAYAPIKNSEGTVVGVIGVDFDGADVYYAIYESLSHYIFIGAGIIAITLFLYFYLMKDIKRQNDNLLFMTQKADEANKSKSKFLATMSHEMRTPMNAIMGVAQIEMQRSDIEESYEDALKRIYISGNNLMGIINDILDISKIETGKLELNLSQYDIPSFIDETVKQNMMHIGSKHIEFILTVYEDFPLNVIGDELRTKQILNNLLSNAIKYTDKGIVHLTIDHEEQDDNIVLCFTVEDTGQGIRPEDRERLFAEFTRVNPKENRTTEGTGLGLSITKKLIELMEGSIELESEHGRGSIFTIKIKQKKAGQEVIGKELAERLCDFTFISDNYIEKMAIDYNAMPYGSVLIVDDVETNLFVAKGLLAPYNLKIETAKSGLFTVKKIESGKKYDIILMDQVMPQMDGIETTQKLRSMGYTGAIVALTANALVGSEAMFINNGFDGFISKPIDIRQLNDVLRKFIKGNSEKDGIFDRDDELRENQSGVNPKLTQIFRKDAEYALVNLRKAQQNNDLKLLITTAHSMKSVLAYVELYELSDLANVLEKAGLNGNKESIAVNTEVLINELVVLTETLALNDYIKSFNDDYIEEDLDYLREQMKIIKSACEEYDPAVAYDALDNLDERVWKAKTTEDIEEIRDVLYLDSDFEKAVELAELFIT